MSTWPPVPQCRDEREVARVVCDHHSLLQYGCCEQGFVDNIQKIASHSNFSGGPITDIRIPRLRSVFRGLVNLAPTSARSARAKVAIGQMPGSPRVRCRFENIWDCTR
jgi:hypothetical protein